MRGAIARLLKLSVKTGLDQAEMGRVEVGIQSHVYSHRPFVPPMQPPQIVRSSKLSRWICRCLLIADTCLMCVDIEGRPAERFDLQGTSSPLNMSEIPKDNTASPKQNEFSPNYFAYYKHVILDLLSENGTCFLPSMEVDSAVPVGMGCGSSSYFSEAVAVGLSEFKKERLLATLNESSSCFNREADEILEHILAAKDIDSNLREKEHDGSYSKAASEEDLDMPLYKRKRKSHPDNIKYSGGNSVSFKQVYKTIQALQGEDEICHEDFEKYTSQLLAKLDKMEESLEDYLNTVVSTCRPMTCIEKHRLGKQIRKLPAKALDRVVEILQPSNFSANNPPESVFVNLEEQDDVKLWRVYYYVELVAKTNKLCI